MNVNPEVYLYKRTLTINNNSDNDSPDNSFIELTLNSANFNFNLCNGTDLVFTEFSNGSFVIDKYICIWNSTIKYARIILNLPSIKAKDSKVIYCFWGSDIQSVNDNNKLNLNFFYDFVINNLDTTKFSYTGSIYNKQAQYGLLCRNNAIVSVKDNVFYEKQRDYSVCVHIRPYAAAVSTGFSLIGSQNYFTLYEYTNTSTTPDTIRVNYSNNTFGYNNIVIDTINQDGIGINMNLVYDLWIRYINKTDKIYYTFNEYDNNYNYIRTFNYEFERNVHSNTVLDRYAMLCNEVYIAYTYASENVDHLFYLEIDYSDLLVLYEYVPPQVISYIEYSDDITSLGYKHITNMDGIVSNIYNNNINNIYDVFLTKPLTYPINYIDIDFSSGLNIINEKITFYDSGHTDKHSSAKMSIDSEDIYYESDSNEGWFAIYLKSVACINNIVFEIYDEDSMITDFKIYGSMYRPVYKSKWKFIYDGSFDTIYRYNVIRFQNTSYYKAYIIEFTSVKNSDTAKIRKISMNLSIDSCEKKNIKQLRLLPIKFDTFELTFPKYIEFIASDDMNNWTTILPKTKTYTPFNDNYHNGWQYYTLDNDSFYYVYRLIVYENWGDTQNRIGIAEWELVELKVEEKNYRILDGNNNIKTVYYDELTNLLYIVNDKLNVIKDNKLLYSQNLENNDDLVIL